MPLRPLLLGRNAAGSGSSDEASGSGAPWPLQADLPLPLDRGPAAAASAGRLPASGIRRPPSIPGTRRCVSPANRSQICTGPPRPPTACGCVFAPAPGTPRSPPPTGKPRRNTGRTRLPPSSSCADSPGSTSRWSGDSGTPARGLAGCRNCSRTRAGTMAHRGEARAAPRARWHDAPVCAAACRRPVGVRGGVRRRAEASRRCGGRPVRVREGFHTAGSLPRPGAQVSTLRHRVRGARRGAPHFREAPAARRAPLPDSEERGNAAGTTGATGNAVRRPARGSTHRDIVRARRRPRRRTCEGLWRAFRRCCDTATTVPAEFQPEGRWPTAGPPRIPRAHRLSSFSSAFSSAFSPAFSSAFSSSFSSAFSACPDSAAAGHWIVHREVPHAGTGSL